MSSTWSPRVGRVEQADEPTDSADWPPKSCQVNQQSTSLGQIGDFLRPIWVGDSGWGSDHSNWDCRFVSVRGFDREGSHVKERWEVYEVDKAIPYYTPICLTSLFSCSFHFFSCLSFILFLFPFSCFLSLFITALFFSPLIFLSSPFTLLRRYLAA